MFQGHGFAHVIALLATSLLFSACSSSDDEKITTKVPRGYERAHKITSDSWQEKAIGAMEHSEGDEIFTDSSQLATSDVASTAAAKPPVWEPSEKKPTLVTKLRRKGTVAARLMLRAVKKVARSTMRGSKRKPRVMARAGVRD